MRERFEVRASFGSGKPKGCLNQNALKNSIVDRTDRALNLRWRLPGVESKVKGGILFEHSSKSWYNTFTMGMKTGRL
jgi:hypothetical protein